MRRRRSEKTKQSKKEKEDNSLKRRRLLKIQSQEKQNFEEEEECGRKRLNFYGCYLLASLCPRFQGHTYIGFTVNPKRRIRQHNGEITSGALRTKKKRPWEMVLCIHGFPTNVAALQFEWAWQHPRESLAVREAATSFKTLGGIANKIKLALTMLTLHSWKCMDLKVSFFSTKYMKHVAGCPSLPQQMKLHFCSMDELPCYGNTDLYCDYEDEDDIHSIDNRQSSNDKLEPSTRESMESCNISYSLENSSDETRSSPIMDPQEIGSSSMIDPLENGLSSIIDPLENGSSSTIDPLENKSSFMIDPLENGLSSMIDPLENGSSSIIDPLKNGSSSIMDNLDNGSFSMMDAWDNVSIMEDTTKKDKITCIVIDDITEEYCEPKDTRIHSPFRFVDTFKPYSNNGVEIIELCTPSPEFRVNAGSKKKKTANNFPDIIDLTTSPSFVEL